MTEEKYKKLNDYLNIIFKELEKNEQFFLQNISPILRTSEMFYEFINEYEFQEDYAENNLSYEDVYKIAREIVELIDKKYLYIYDKMIDDGALNFNYEKDNSGSWCRIRNNKILIDIERKFNYDDICTLIHEFIHLTNLTNWELNGITDNRYILTEFISIYFEIFAQKYLLENYNVSKDSIGIYSRLNFSKACADNIIKYAICFLTYYNSGNLNEKSYEFAKEFFTDESKESFEDKCENLLKISEKIDKDYRNKILYEKEFDEEEFSKYGIKRTDIRFHYKYLLGTLLAYYAIENIDIKNMITLNDFINTEESSQMSPIDLLYNFGININEFEYGAFESIGKILEDKKKMR